MKTISQLFLLIALGLSSLNGCSKSSDKEQTAETYAPLEDLIQAERQVEADLSLGFLLRSSTERVMSEFRSNLYDVRAATYLLRENPLDPFGLAQLHASYKSTEALNILQDDRTLLEDFLSKLRSAVEFVANMQGTSLDGFGDERLRTLFTQAFNLNDELGKFSSYLPAQNQAQSWKVATCGPRCGNLEYVIAQVERPGDETWLLAPRMSLPDRDQLQLTIDGSGRGPLVDVLEGKMNRRFRVLVSENFTEGQDPRSASWIDITDDLSNYPLGKIAGQFRSFKLETDLSRFRGKTLTIGMKLSAGPSEQQAERTDTQWQLTQFTIKGKGVLALAGASATP